MALAERRERQTVLDLLESLRRPGSGNRLEPLRKLLAQLNYEPASASLATPAGIDPATLADSPRVLAVAGSDEAFQVIYTRLSGDALPRMAERPVVERLLKDHPYALFVFSNAAQDRWHFLNVKSARAKKISADAEADERDPKLRRIFRRISVTPDDRLRTATERLDRLDLSEAVDPSALSPLAIQDRHDEAFDVEAVTDQFFKTYRMVFEEVEKAIKGLRGHEARRMFTQRLFNRLMFIAFIQKKGWLKYDGMEDNDYLGALWKSYKGKTKEDSNFYNERLRRLFFQGLNNAASLDLMRLGREKLAGDTLLHKLIGDVPYLNGGLFEKSDAGTDDDLSIVVPDKAIDLVLHELFDRFNFTVTESTPLDVEVAVDPEMLGKVFEELVTGRHETGSYYTPKPIVSYMCREALKGYLQAKRPTEKADAIAAFVDEHNPKGLRDSESVLEALRKVKVCDPACGSGAYLLGMLHELLDLRQSLFQASRLDDVTVYDRKLEIIQNNVYGVDIDPFAVNIARLRLWLSLAVDFNGPRPPPLPNLDFKIETGDSLAPPDPSGGFDPGFRQTFVDDFLKAKGEFLLAHGQEKIALKKKISELREKLGHWAHADGPVKGFDWPVEFAEVFTAGGFDVIVANPPYVRQELIKDQKPILKRVYPEVYVGTADLYCYFYARGLQLLSPGGMLAFISSNKWFRAGYGQKLRSLIARETSVRTILDFHDLPVFDSAIAYPMIFTASKTPPRGGHTAMLVEPADLEPPYPDVTAVVERYRQALRPAALAVDGSWNLASATTADRLVKMRASGRSLKDLIGSRVYRGLTTGLNEAFVIDDETRLSLIEESPKNSEIIKRFVAGKDVHRWRLSEHRRWIIVTRIGVQMKRYPAVLRHLKKFEEALKQREDQGDEWWELRPCTYYDEFEKPKIVSTKVSIEPTFALDEDGRYLGNTSYFLPIAKDPFFVLAVLNSASAKFYAKQVFVEKQNGWYEVQPTALEEMPIPDAATAERVALSSLARRCVEAKGIGCEQLENVGRSSGSSAGASGRAAS